MIILDPVKYNEIQNQAFSSLRETLSTQFDRLIDELPGGIDPETLINIYTEILEATHTAEEQIFNILSVEVSKQAFCEMLEAVK